MSRRKSIKTPEEAKAGKSIDLVKPAEKKAGSDQEGKNLIYVGPTIPTVAIQNQVYTGIPEGAVLAMEREPELGNLFIQIADYPKANRMLRERAGYIFRAYMSALRLRK